MANANAIKKDSKILYTFPMNKNKQVEGKVLFKTAKKIMVRSKLGIMSIAMKEIFPNIKIIN